MTPSGRIDQKVAELNDWRGELYSRLRKLINETAPDLKEDWKWDTAVWKGKGMVCAVSAFTGHVKINFFKGATLEDPDKLFNSGLDSKQHRSINFAKDSPVDEDKLRTLIQGAEAMDRG